MRNCPCCSRTSSPTSATVGSHARRPFRQRRVRRGRTRRRSPPRSATPSRHGHPGGGGADRLHAADLAVEQPGAAGPGPRSRPSWASRRWSRLSSSIGPLPAPPARPPRPIGPATARVTGIKRPGGEGVTRPPPYGRETPAPRGSVSAIGYSNKGSTPVMATASSRTGRNGTPEPSVTVTGTGNAVRVTGCSVRRALMRISSRDRRIRVRRAALPGSGQRALLRVARRCWQAARGQSVGGRERGGRPRQ